MFKHQIEISAKRNNSNIVLALDLTGERNKEKLLSKSMSLLDKLSNLVCAVKINRHLTLPLGLFDGVDKLIKFIHKFELPVIMDCKINDVGSTNLIIAKNYFEAGFDAVTVNPVVGWVEGLKPVFDLAHKNGKGVITIVYMSHKGAKEFYERKITDNGKLKSQYKIFAEKSLKWKAEGVVVGATKPQKIGEVKKILGEKIPIYSPGIGFQGGKVKNTLLKGAKFLIVGRTIINSKNPRVEAEKILEEASKFIRF